MPACWAVANTYSIQPTPLFLTTGTAPGSNRNRCLDLNDQSSVQLQIAPTPVIHSKVEQDRWVRVCANSRLASPWVTRTMPPK